MKIKVPKFFSYIIQLVLLACFKLHKICKPFLSSTLKIENLKKKSVYSQIVLVIFLLATALVVSSLGTQTANAVGITKYARSTGGNWSADATWSTTSNGAADTVKPTASDDVVFDNFSGPVTIDAASVAKSINCTGYTNTLTHNAFTLTVSGSITFVSTMTYTPLATSTISFDATATLTTGTKLMPNVANITGSLTLGDNLSFMASQLMYFTLWGGTTVNLNGKTVSGNSTINRLLIQSNQLGQARTITVSAGTFAYADFQDITFSNGGNDLDLSAITGNSGDCGGNTNATGGKVVTFTTAAAQTWTNAAGGSWSTAANWTSRVPLPQDDVWLGGLNGAGFTYNSGVTVNTDVPRLGKSISWIGASWGAGTATTFAVTFSSYSVYGSFTLISSLTFAPGSNTIVFRGRGQYYLTSAGKTFGGLAILAPTGTLILNDAFRFASSVGLGDGTIDTAGYNIIGDTIYPLDGTARGIILRSSTITLSASWNMGHTIGVTVDAGTSTIALGAGATWFNGGGSTYNNITIAPGAAVVIFVGPFTFANMTMASAGTKTVNFYKNRTLTMTGTDFLSGSATGLVTITSDDGTTAATLNKTGGVAVNSDYLDITVINVTPAITWYYGNNSVWHSGTGWNAGAPPAPTVPDAPTIGSATRGNSSASITFTPPGNNGGSPITGYTVTSTPESHTGTGSASPVTVSGLTNGTSYTFTVHATNAIGDSVESAASNGVTPFAVPGAPTIGVATSSNAQASVTFSAPESNGGTPITDYTVTSTPGSLTGTGAGSPITVNGLTDGTSYTFTVHATNAIGVSAESAASNVVIPDAVPNIPNSWAYRRQITVSTANVDANLTDYPVLVKLSTSSGISGVDLTPIFTELGTNNLKLAVTASDGVTQLYVEVVSWDATNKLAELWVKVPTVSGTVDTTLYIYYDSTHADNTAYVGVTGSTPGKAVWDSSFAAVYHLNDGGTLSDGGTPEPNVDFDTWLSRVATVTNPATPRLIPDQSYDISQFNEIQLTVDKDDSSQVLLFYGGVASPKVSGVGTIERAYASTSDLTAWTKYASNPILSGTAGKFDAVGVRSGSVLVYNNLYYLYYSAQDAGGIGLATSSDGISFTKQNSGNAILGDSGGETYMMQPAVLKDGANWYMYYQCNYGGAVVYRLATSSDGVSWTKTGTTILTVGGSGAWDGGKIEAHHITKRGSAYVLTYEAGNSDFSEWAIGLAYSSSPTTPFTKYVGNPYLRKSGVVGAYDRYHVAGPAWVTINGVDYFGYLGANTVNYAIADWAFFLTQPTSGTPFQPVQGYLQSLDSTGVNDGLKSSVNNPLEIAGLIGKGQFFNENTSQIDCGNDTSINLSTHATIEAIVKTDSATQAILGKSNNGNDIQWGLRVGILSEGYASKFAVLNGSWYQAIGTTAVNDNAWRYITGTLDGAHLQDYQAGLPEGSAIALTTLPTTSLNLILGSIQGSKLRFSGSLDEVRISNVARSAAYIKANNYNFTDALVTYEDTVNNTTPTSTPTPTPTPTSTATPTSSESATPSRATVTPTLLRRLFTWITGATTSSSASFTTIPTDLTNIEVGQTITFDASSSGSDIVKYEWDFGDGTTSNEMKVEHKYDTPGRYTVTLTTTDKSGNTSTVSKTIDIRPAAPTITNIKADGTSIVFEGKSFPSSTVSLTIHSNPYTGQTVADKDGKFSYTLENGSDTIGEGGHTVLANATIILSDNTELTSKDSKTYDFNVSVDNGKLKVEMGKTKTWKYISLGLGLLLVIGIGFVLFRARKRRRR